MLYECERVISIEKDVIINLVTAKGWSMTTLYESVLYKCEWGWTNEAEEEKIHAPYQQEAQYQAAFCGSLNTSDWKDPVLEGRTIIVYDPTGESAKISIDNPEVSKENIATLLDIFIKYKNALAVTKRMTGPIRNFSFKIPQKENFTPIVTIRPYVNPVAGKEADRQIDKLFEDVMIELSVSNYNSPLVL